MLNFSEVVSFDVHEFSNWRMFLLLGTFGYVDHVRHPIEQNWEFARKTIKHNEKMDANGDISATAIREISILKTLNHPNIIKWKIELFDSKIIDVEFFFKFRLIRVEYNLEKKDFLSFFLEMFPTDLKRYMDACLSTERLSPKLIQVDKDKNKSSFYFQWICFSKSYTYQILSAVDYLHRRAIVNRIVCSFYFIRFRIFKIHRDIKPSNTVLNYDGKKK